ncbi:unnamed protein product [Camellia sinensis]
MKKMEPSRVSMNVATKQNANILIVEPTTCIGNDCSVAKSENMQHASQ